MKALTNADAVLLWILLEQEPISGNAIDRILEVRGYRDWARIGKTSVYMGLKRLEEKGLVRSRRDVTKTGRGPKPQLYRTSPEGGRVGRSAIIEMLSTTRERDVRFQLAISAIQVLDRSEAVKALRARRSFLQKEQKRLQKEYKTFHQCLPLGGDALYQHILSSIKNEISLMATLIDWRSKTH